MVEWDNEEAVDDEFVKAKKKDGIEDVLDLSDEEDEDDLFGDFDDTGEEE